MPGMFGGYQPEAMPQIQAPQFPQQMPQRGGMFGGKADIPSAIQAAIGGYLAGRGVPGGAQILSQLHQRQMMAQQQAMEEANYQRQRQDGMQDWITKQEYEATHPDPVQPTQTDRYINELMDPNTPPERKKILSQVLLPPVMGVVNGVPAMIDRASMFGGGGPAKATPPAEAIAELKANPQSAAQFDEIFGQGAAAGILGSGGPTPQASGGFPY